MAVAYDTGGTSNGAATSWTVGLSGVAANDSLVVIVLTTFQESNTLANAGWTIHHAEVGDGDAHILWQIGSGAWADEVLTLSGAAVQYMGGWASYTGVVSVEEAADLLNTNPDPLTASRNLYSTDKWFCACAARATGVTTPAGYTVRQSGTPSGDAVGLFDKVGAKTATENPGDTMSGVTESAAQIAITLALLGAELPKGFMLVTT
jgi:hypothetical protein